jgi:hypothetical protein
MNHQGQEFPLSGTAGDESADVASLRMLRRAKDRIDRDYAGQIGIPALAAGAGASPPHASARRQEGLVLEVTPRPVLFR